VRYTQLHGRQLQRTNAGTLIIWIAGMHHSSQYTPNDDISTGNDLRSRVDIAQYDNVAGMVDSLTGTDGTSYQESITCFS